MEKPSDENENIVVSHQSAITKGTATTIAAIATTNGVSLNNNNVIANAAATPSDNYIKEAQTMVITGCNSGVGLDIIKHLSSSSTPKHRLILA
mmetsp:Transcript_23514/g.31165  ORF Transcript_23514/g.31165 Transcript_23514/m.31165 type:complete len:93 (-) Transcript_23514:2383-2661(-)